MDVEAYKKDFKKLHSSDLYIVDSILQYEFVSRKLKRQNFIHWELLDGVVILRYSSLFASHIDHTIY